MAYTFPPEIQTASANTAQKHLQHSAIAYFQLYLRHLCRNTLCPTVMF